MCLKCVILLSYWSFLNYKLLKNFPINSQSTQYNTPPPIPSPPCSENQTNYATVVRKSTCSCLSRSTYSSSKNWKRSNNWSFPTIWNGTTGTWITNWRWKVSSWGVSRRSSNNSLIVRKWRSCRRAVMAARSSKID